MKKLFLFFLSVSLLLSGCAGKNNTNEKKSSDKLTVYTTVYPLQYFSERIGGQYAETHTIYPPGADEHSFEPTQKDMIKLADADLFIYIGLGLEGFVEKAKTTLKNEDVKMISAGDRITFEPHTEGEEHHEDDGHHHGDIDPHVWIDPVYAKDLANSVKEAFIAEMPNHEEEFNANFDVLAKELDQLNADFTDMVNQAAIKEFFVSHAAFGYWEKRYNIKQVSISGLNSSDEPTQKELQNIISEAQKYHLQYIFIEQNVTSKPTEVIINELGAEALVLHNLSVLTDEDIKNNETYFTLMERNIDHLKKALNQ